MAFKDIANLFDSTEYTPRPQSEQKEYEEVPDGRYASEILEMAMRNTRNGDPFINIKARIAEGPYASKYIFPNIYFSTNPAQINVAKGQLAILGLEGVKFKDLKNRISRITGLRITITKKTNKSKDGNKDFVNYYFDADKKVNSEPDAGFDD